ncbi:MAG: metallophosphoesterase family protein [Myxococcales bacterium]|nr:metallophosphoesterase family protein [Myxococcales bacterium]
MASRLQFGVLGLVAVSSVYGLLASCTDDTPELIKVAKPDTGTVDDTGVVVTPKFTPAGCNYTTTPPKIEGFPDFEKHEDAVGPTPDLRYVRRGIGGNTDKASTGYADPSTSFVVGWQSDAATKASRMRFGEAADKLDKTQDGFSYLVQQDRLKSGPAEGVRFHEVHLCGLTPGRTYYYQVGGGPSGKEVWSPVYSLTTAPVKGTTDKVLFGIAGDSRDADGRSTQPTWGAIAKRLKNAGVGMTITTGDSVLFGYNQDLWDIWSKATGDAGTSVFFAMSLGNHESEFIRNYGHLLMPTSGTEHSERYGSFDWGPVHFIMIDDFFGVVSPSADDTGTYKTELLAWLDKDLGKANENRAAVPWIVTFHHHPMYSSTTQKERAAERTKVKEAFQALFDKHHVNLDVAGHDHFYERNNPIKGDKADPTGTTYLIDAAAGAPAYSTTTDNPFSAKIQKYQDKDPAAYEGIYTIVTADTASFKLTTYTMQSAASGSSPADDKVLESVDFAK